MHWICIFIVIFVPQWIHKDQESQKFFFAELMPLQVAQTTTQCLRNYCYDAFRKWKQNNILKENFRQNKYYSARRSLKRFYHNNGLVYHSFDCGEYVK